MEFNVKGTATLDDFKIYYKQAAARSIFYRLFTIFITTFLVLELIIIVAGDISSKKFNAEYLVIFMATYLVLLALKKLIFPKAVKKMYESDKTLQLENEMTFTETQIESKDELHQEIIKKENIYSVLFGDSGVYIYKSKARVEIVPKHYFESEEQWNTFVEFAKQNYVPEGKKPRIYKPLKWWMTALSVLAAVAVVVCFFISALN